MQVEQVYVGGWFQRTTLHLSELYDFLSEASSPLSFKKSKLKKLHKSLEISDLQMKVGKLQYIDLKTKNKINYKIYEDGLIILNSECENIKDLPNKINLLTSYYEKKLSPAYNYIFSLGAPVPKELANIKNVYPYFVILNNTTSKEAIKLLTEFNQTKYFEVNNKSFDIFRGDKLYLINNKKERLENISSFVEEQIFIREFKGQLHRYLNLHRIIWENIAEIKERGKIKGYEIGTMNTKIEKYSKTINLIDTRINQMNTYIRTRESITKSSVELKNFLPILEYKYETLNNSLSYIRGLWSMTRNYVSSAMNLFSELQSKATQKSVENLTVVTSMGVGATLIGLFARDQLPSISWFGVVYFLILALIGYTTNKLIKWYFANKNYTISYTDYDKDIK